MSQATAVSLEALRARIAAIEGARVHQQRDPSGLAALDQAIQGLPRPGLVALHGAPGSGRAHLVAGIFAQRTARAESVAWIDADRTLYPPALAQHGVDLSYLLVVRPPAGHAIWAAEQVLRSGCFPVVAISGVGRLGSGGQRWARAVEQGRCVGLVLADPEPSAGRDLPAALRLQIQAGRFTVVRDRAGAFGRRGALPAPAERADPWQHRRWS